MPSERSDLRVLVVGGGSIGRRHLGNLRALGVEHLAVCDNAEDRRSAIVSEFGVAAFEDVESAYRAFAPDAVLVCTPPNLHVRFASGALEHGSHVFIEKPLSDAMDGLERLKTVADQQRLTIQVGYNWRFHDGLIKVNGLLERGAIGRVLWARAELGQYLPDWRPQVDYRANYTARRAMGGGIILDGSHELDYLRWLLGEPNQVYCVAGSLSDLEVDVEDTASIVMRMVSGAQVEVHLDFVQRTRARNCKIVGTEGTIVWDYVAHELKLFHLSRGEWEHFEIGQDASVQYVAEMEEFLDCVATGRASRVDFNEGCRTLKVALAALESARTNLPVAL